MEGFGYDDRSFSARHPALPLQQGSVPVVGNVTVHPTSTSMYPKNLLYAYALIGICALPACHKGTSYGEGMVRLHVTGTWEGQPFQASQEHHDVLNHRVFVDGLKLYLSDVQLKGPSGQEDLLEVGLFNLTVGEGVSLVKVPAGTYGSLLFGLGVRPDLNMSDPSQYAAGHPLSVSNGTYWTWASGYRFVMFDGRFDTDPNGTGTVLPTFSIHSGKNDCYTTAERLAPSPIHVEPGDTTDVYLNFAVDRFFYTQNDTIDISVDNQSHGENLTLALRFTDCFVQSTTLH
mgnify:CR=1 FL=1